MTGEYSICIILTDYYFNKILYIIKCSSRFGNPVENYSELSEHYRGNGITANVYTFRTHRPSMLGPAHRGRTVAIPKTENVRMIAGNVCYFESCMYWLCSYAKLALFHPPLKRENRRGRVNRRSI